MKFKNWLLTESKKYKYSSTQCNFPPEAAGKVLKWSKNNIPNNVLIYNDHANRRENEIHTTILYGLHTNEIEDVKKIISNFHPFEITLGEVSKFTNNEYDVIKIDVESKELKKLNRALKKLEHTNNFPTYHPHCTIAYVKKDSCNHLIGDLHFDGIKVKVNKIIFSPSEGRKTLVNLTN